MASWQQLQVTSIALHFTGSAVYINILIQLVLSILWPTCNLEHETNQLCSPWWFCDPDQIPLTPFCDKSQQRNKTTCASIHPYPF
jgi:hypothetical protein